MVYLKSRAKYEILKTPDHISQFIYSNHILNNMLNSQLLASAVTNLQLLPFFSKKSTSWFASESGMELVSSVSQGSISTGCISVISRSAVDSMGPTAKWRDWRMTYDWLRWIVDEIQLKIIGQNEGKMTINCWKVERNLNERIV